MRSWLELAYQIYRRLLKQHLQARASVLRDARAAIAQEKQESVIVNNKVRIVHNLLSL